MRLEEKIEELEAEIRDIKNNLASKDDENKNIQRDLDKALNHLK